MKLPDGEFAWGLGDNSTGDMTVRTFKAFARRMYASYCHDLSDTNVFDQQLQIKVGMIQDRLAAGGRLTLKPGHRGTLDLATEIATTFKVPPVPVYAPKAIFFSINGAGSTWNMGYPYDIGEEVKKHNVYHQPIGYNTAPVPMNNGVQDGILKFIAELEKPRIEFGGRNCETIPWTYVFYSMGALVGCAVLARVLFGDLQRFKWTYLGGGTFGNPRRQKDHTFPGCSWSSGEGISTPTDSDMPIEHWDMAADKHMPGPGGDDLYTKMGDDEGPVTDVDMRAVWDIINKGNPLNLAAAVFQLMAKPSFSSGYSAAVAAFKALDFFVVKQTGPHVRYQFTQPIDGDQRDCWQLLLAHAIDLTERLQPVYKQGVAA